MARLNTPAALAVAALAMLGLGGCGGNEAPSDTAPAGHIVSTGAVTIDSGWVRAVPAGVAMSAGFAEITNTGSEPDRIIALSSPVATAVELHESKEVDGRATMRQVEDPVLAAGETLTLAPGGYHLMLIGLTGPLVEGETVPIIITFDTAGEVTVPFTVQQGPQGGHDGH